MCGLTGEYRKIGSGFVRTYEVSGSFSLWGENAELTTGLQIQTIVWENGCSQKRWKETKGEKVSLDCKG